MNRPPVQLGSVVLSRAGRDNGRYFVVVGQADDEHVLIADGRLRKVESPKKKKLKHLTPKPACMSEIQIKLDKGELIQDAQIRKFLASNGFKPNDKQEE